MKGLLLMLSVIVWGDLLAQKHDNIWFVGHNITSNGRSAKFDFGYNPVQIDSINRYMPMDLSSVSMCDSAGSLLFYTNSIWINNAQNQLMDNGDSLNPGVYADNNRWLGYCVPDGSIAIPHPKQANKYYLFHQSYETNLATAGFGEHLYYTLIDMNANNGLGRVEKKNQILVSDSICQGQVEVAKHANGKDWWLIQPMAYSNGFYVFLITEDTILLFNKQYIGAASYFGSNARGQAVFTPNGTKYARYDWRNDLDVFDFDRCTGELKNPLHIPIQDTCDNRPGSASCGISVSPNGRYLYVSSMLLMYQFDLQASDIGTSIDTVAIYDNFPAPLQTVFGYLQLAPDGKIYGHAQSTRYLHVINNPDVGGDSCDVQQHAIDIYYPNGHFLPNFPHYRTPALDSLACVDTTHSGVNVVQVDKNANEVRLFPNPVNNELIIELSTIPNTEILVQIIDLTGKVLLQKTIQNSSNFLQIPTTNLSNGMYFVRVHLDNKMIAQPLLIERY